MPGVCWWRRGPGARAARRQVAPGVGPRSAVSLRAALGARVPGVRGGALRPARRRLGASRRGAARAAVPRRRRRSPDRELLARHAAEDRDRSGLPPLAAAAAAGRAADGARSRLDARVEGAAARARPRRRRRAREHAPPRRGGTALRSRRDPQGRARRGRGHAGIPAPGPDRSLARGRVPGAGRGRSVNVAASLSAQARLALRSAWAGGRARRGLVPLALALPVAAVLGASFTAMFRALDAAAAPAGAASAPVGYALGWVYTLTLVAMVAGDLHVVASAAIAAPDLEVLLAAPLGPRRIFAMKLVETLPRTLLPVLAVTLPAAIAYARVNGGSGLAALVVGPLTLWAVPLGLGSALALPLARLAPGKRWRESLAVFATFA